MKNKTLEITSGASKNYIFIKSLICKLVVYYECLRLKEILLIGGVTFIGLLFATNHFDQFVFFKWFIVMMISYTLLGHSFLFNDLSGFTYDQLDVNKKNRPLIRGDISLHEVKILSIILLVITLSLSVYISLITLLMTIGVVILNYLYSGNKIFLKSIPVVSSLVHGLGATLGFLIGYTFEGKLNASGVLFGIYFGIIYAAGHLNHEISDFESDQKYGISTNPKLFGKMNAFIAAFVLFSLSFFYISFLSAIDLLPAMIIVGAILFYPFYVFSFVQTLKTKLDFTSMISFRKKYRIIFLAWGIYIAISLIIN